jgi:hypothetical protein
MEGMRGDVGFGVGVGVGGSSMTCILQTILFYTIVHLVQPV